MVSEMRCTKNFAKKYKNKHRKQAQSKHATGHRNVKMMA